MKKFKVYAKINSDSYITAIDSSAFLTDLIDWLEIDEGSGDKFHHAQGNYFDKPLKTENGVYQYKLEDGVVRECTAEELAEQEAALPQPEPAPQPEPEPSVWDELDGAYNAGYESGYTEGVNSI